MKSSKLETGSSVKHEPIALVGIGCRFPGDSHDVESFWELLLKGSDAIVDIPPERWNWQRFYDPDVNKPGKMYVKQGGFLQQRLEEFDALFFGISPREAECIDPQQRLLLETSWEALEDAGIPLDSLDGSSTGVFIGAFTLDHQLTQMGQLNRQMIGPHTAIGSTMTILSNRISYMLNLRGPSMSLDTACSSSMVALHLGCQAIWHGECDLALVGGASVMMRPEYPIAMCKGGFLAPDGRSKSFDASADGYGRGEGAGVVVLKPLSAALADGDSIYSLIRGTGVNQDGRTNGITVPNPQSQSALIRQVCKKYGVRTHDISYFEAHGTGTPVGDPLEAQALGAAIGTDGEEERAEHGEKRTERCLVGSVKATIGHLEAAAGVAGIIKASLCLSHRQVPPQANLQTPNPSIPFDELGLRLPRALESLGGRPEPIYAGINSFGYGGTNAYAVLENAPASLAGSRTEDEPGTVHMLPLSARSDAALTALAKAWLEKFTEDRTGLLKDVSYSAACRRSHHDYRLGIAADSLAEVREQLADFVSGGKGKWLTSGKIESKIPSRPVFVYSGMGPQWWAMGRELYWHNACYREAVERGDAVFHALSGWSILEEMLAAEKESRMADTTIAQPANFLLQIGLTAVWRFLGVEPAAILGHSVGEVAAAHASGVLSLEDAVKVSYERSRIQKKAAGLGKMLAVGIGLEKCADLLSKFSGEALSIAAVNSPSSITLAGDSSVLESISACLTESGEFNRFLQVELAYHSAFMEPLKPELRKVLAHLKPSLPSTPLYSTVTGKRVEDIAYDAEYWCNNVRKPVLFSQAMESLLRDGHRVFLEIGPHPVLSAAIKQCGLQQDVKPQAIASLRREQPERRSLGLALAGLYVAGCKMNWRTLYPEDAAFTKLPTYPWQRETYWREDQESIANRTAIPLHSLLDQRLPDPRPSWQSLVNRQFLPYLSDHKVDGLVVMPGAAFVEAALAAHKQLKGSTACVIENLYFHRALVLNDDSGEPYIHVSVDEESGEYAFHSRENNPRMDWRLHASGRIQPGSASASGSMARHEIAQNCAKEMELDELYEDLSRRGLFYGPHFRTIRQLSCGPGEVLARIELHPDFLEESSGYLLHPTLLDGCFQSLIAAVEERDRFYMPVQIRRLSYHGVPKDAFWCHAKLVGSNDSGIEGDLAIFDEDGRMLVEVQGLRCQTMKTGEKNPAEHLAKWTYAWQWSRQALLSAGRRAGCWLVFSDQGGIGESLCQELESDSGNQVIRVSRDMIYGKKFCGMRPLQQDECANLKRILVEAQARGCVGVAYLWGLTADVRMDDPVGITQAGVALQVIQMLGQVFQDDAPRLYIVTRGLQSVADGATDMENIAQAPLAGLARVALNEYPVLGCTLVDLDAFYCDGQIRLLGQELMANDCEDDVSFRGVDRFVHRWGRAPVASFASGSPSLRRGGEVEAFQLKWGKSLEFHSMPFPVPRRDEVAITLEFISLASIAFPCGGDEMNEYFAFGVVSEVGGGVANWRRGDRVIAAVTGVPASHVTCPAERVFSTAHFGAIPHAEIATLPGSIIPTYYALKHIARVTRGEAVLIDAGLGVDAQAAARVSRWLGAVPCLYRVNAQETLDWEDGLAVPTGEAPPPQRPDGAGLPPVRAWMHGAAASGGGARAAAQLAPNAHEILFARAPAGRNSIAGSSGIPASCGVSHVDPMRLALSAPALFDQLLKEAAQFLLGDQPFPEIEMLSLQEALSFLSRETRPGAETIPVMSVKDNSSPVISDGLTKQALFDAGASYLITGGFGGFGLETAEWMAKHGARHLILASRSGASSDASRAALKALENNKVRIIAVAADVSEEAQVTALLARVAAEFPPLRGILHCAAVLDDAPISELNPGRMENAMRAKALGAWHLHRCSQGHPLDFFVLFSSVSAIIGNGRQANYSAANAYLDTLAEARRAMGLPATSINWGAISTGMAVESEEVKAHLEVMGMRPLTATQALDAWACLLDAKAPQYGLMDIDWPRWREFEPTGGNSPRFSDLMGMPGAKLDGSQLLTETCKEISLLPENERKPAMSAALAEQVARVLRLPAGKMNWEQPLTNMGVDSLMAAELQASISKIFGVRLSTLELMRGHNVTQLADVLTAKIILPPPNSIAETEIPEESVIDRMSREDVDILLGRLLPQ